MSDYKFLKHKKSTIVSFKKINILILKIAKQYTVQAVLCLLFTINNEQNEEGIFYVIGRFCTNGFFWTSKRCS